MYMDRDKKDEKNVKVLHTSMAIRLKRTKRGKPTDLKKSRWYQVAASRFAIASDGRKDD